MRIPVPYPLLVLSSSLLLVAAAMRAEPVPTGEGVAFNGRSTYVSVPADKAFDLAQLTVSAWVKLEKAGGTQVFVDRGARGKLFTLYLYNGKVRMLVEYAPGEYSHADAPPPTAGVWAHYAGTYDGKEIRVYLNGKRVQAVRAVGRIPLSEEPLLLGAEPAGSTLDGRLEDVRLWKRALSEAEVARVASGAETAKEDLMAHWQSEGFDGKVWRNLESEALTGRFLDDPRRPTADAGFHEPAQLLLQKDNGYHGIWYYNQPSNDEYVYKYSGGLGTYPANHLPFAIYAPQVNKTFFCYGGTVPGKNELLHMVSYYDHATGMVPRPTILLNKHTDDAHDNPVMSIDDQGYLWIFSSSHGTSRPSYLTRSTKPYSIDTFENVLTTNFSYPQPWYLPGQGFLFLHTRYQGGRCIFEATSKDGRTWSEGRLLAKIEEGHYQVSGRFGNKVGTAYMMHPQGKGLNWRTNLYYMESDDFGAMWRNAQGEALQIPITQKLNPALVHDYQAEGLNVYIQDLSFDATGHPVVLYTTSKGYESGPENGPRVWHTARWTGTAWDLQGTITSDSNYDCGSLYLEGDGRWRIIGPTQPGPQPYNPGGEVAMWTSPDQGKSWTMARQLTHDSEFNHTYVRRPLNAQPDFYAFWADGHARRPSESRLYFCNKNGDVFRLPTHMEGDFARPEPVK